MKICVFASGAGTNFKAIIDSVKKGFLSSEISLLISNNPDCDAVKIAAVNNIEFKIINRKFYGDYSDEDYSEVFMKFLSEYSIDFIVLAGYMQIVPSVVVKKFHYRIINIHPALLPSFGGKGMYGLNVHKAVIESGVKISGVTIHFVNEDYDKGSIIFQKCCDVNFDDDKFSLQEKIRKLEHEYYPVIIRKFEEGKVELLNGKVRVS